jgi:hypothetical protein
VYFAFDRHQGWLAGAQLSFDPQQSKLTKTNFAVGYQAGDFVLHTNVYEMTCFSGNCFAIRGVIVLMTVLLVYRNDGQEFTGSVYQKVNSQLESGINLAWTSGNNTTRFGLGCIYKLDSDSSIKVCIDCGVFVVCVDVLIVMTVCLWPYFKAKVNNASQIGLAFTHRLRPGIALTLTAMIDGKNFNQGGHKLGMGFDLEA